MFHPSRTRLAGVLIVGATVLVACSGADDAVTVVTTDGPSTTTTIATLTTRPLPSTTTSTTTTAPPTTTTVPAVPRQPLTGTPLDDGEAVIARPALAVKIDNAPAARRNHQGLGAADIVFEEIVEANITRFAAVFHSQGSETVGPIRSGRSQDVDLLLSYNRPLFAWSGGNPGVTRLIADSPFVDLNATRNGRGYYRGSGSRPHNLYNDTETLWSQTPDDHPGPPGLQFAYVRPGDDFIGDPVTDFDLVLRSIDVNWQWDAESGMFLRSQEGAAHNDALHGRIDAKNVVVLAVEYRPSQIDARSPEAQTIGEGRAVVFSDGKVRPGRWFRERNTDAIQLLTEEGGVIEIEPGPTWVELAEAQASDDPRNPNIDIAVYFPE